MPVIIAVAIRYVIMAAVQLGLWSLIEKYGLPLINKSIVAIMEAFGVSEEEAQDIMANKIIVAFEQVGIFAVTLKTKMPVKVAERLGFTSKGFSLRKLKSAKAVTAEKAVVSATSKTIATGAEAKAIGETVALSRGLKTLTVVSFIGVIMGIVSATSNMVLAVANVMDFGNWQGAYQKTFQKIFTAFGFPPDSPMPKARTLSAETWQRIYATVETLDPVGISYPFSSIDKPYSRENLANLIDELAANIVKDGGQATYKNVIGLALPLIQLKGQPDVNKMDKLVFTGTPTAGSTKTSSSSVSSTTKVFTGIVSQGVVGQGLVFTPRPDDLIESVDELRDAAANNLAPFLASLPAKVVYEVKVVSSIITKDGFKQTGTTRQVQAGTYSNGTPKYKTITNKFATLVLYIITDRGTRTKLTTIVLGPVDSARLTVGQNDLRALETSLPKLVTTSNVNDISGIETANPITITTPPQVVEPVMQTQVEEGVDTGWRFYSFSVNGEEYLEVLPWAGNIPTGHTMLSKDEYLKRKNAMLQSNPTRWKAFFDSFAQSEKLALGGGKSGLVIKDGVPMNTDNASVPNTVPVVSSSKPTTIKSAANATTLSEWYQAQGRSLPSVGERSVTYEGLGLGPRSYYTGTAEQNTKLLNALKSGTNVTASSVQSDTSHIVDGMYLQV